VQKTSRPISPHFLDFDPGKRAQFIITWIGIFPDPNSTPNWKSRSFVFGCETFFLQIESQYNYITEIVASNFWAIVQEHYLLINYTVFYPQFDRDKSNDDI